MNKNQKTKEKTCAFYASDYHFEMISLPYINKKLDESKEVIVLTENNLKETIKTLVSKINLNEDKKVDILKIDWENNDLNKFKKINEDIKSKKDMVIFVKGKENYIKNINENIEKWRRKKAIEITYKKRPDLLKNKNLSEMDVKLLSEVQNKCTAHE